MTPGAPFDHTSQLDPSTRIDTIDMMLGVLAATTRMWSEGGPLSGEAEVSIPADRAARLARLIANRSGTPHGHELAEACASGDPDALAAAATLAHYASGFGAPKSIEALASEYFKASEFAAAERAATFGSELMGCLDRSSEALLLLWIAGRSAKRTGRFGEVVDYLTRAVDIPQTDENRALLAVCHDLLGWVLGQTGNFPDALWHHDRAESLVEGDANCADVLTNRSMTLGLAGYYERAERAAEQAVMLGQRGRVSGSKFGILLDNLASAAQAAGNLERASSVVGDAERFLADASTRDQLVNLMSRAELAGELGRTTDGATLFNRAHDLAMSAAREALSKDHYRAGFTMWLNNQVPADDPVLSVFVNGVRRQGAGEFGAAARCFAEVAKTAANRGDLLLELRAVTNFAASAFGARDMDQAIAACQRALHAARVQGLALPQAMASGTLASLINQGADAGSTVDVLVYEADALALTDLHEEIKRELGNPDVRVDLRIDVGVVHNSLGLMAARFGNHALAVKHLRRSLDSAVTTGNLNGQAMRSANLLDELSVEAASVEKPGGAPGRSASSEHEAERVELAARLAGLVQDERLAAGFRIQASLALLRRRRRNGDCSDTEASRDLEGLAVQLERLRANLPAGSGRARIDEQHKVYPLLVNSLIGSGQLTHGWEALQRLRAGDLMEALTAQSGSVRPYAPPDLSEARELLAGVGSGATLVDLQVDDEGLHAFIVTGDAFERVDALGDLTDLHHLRWGEPLTRAADTMRLLTTSVFNDLATRVREVTGARDVLLSVDDKLANLPWHSIPITEAGGARWGEVQLISRIPAVGLLRFGQARPPLSGRSLVAGDSRGDLPGAAQECAGIGKDLTTSPLLGRNCSLAAVTEAISGDLDFIHLAVHGYADPRTGGSSSLLFADDEKGTRWTRWSTLAEASWTARVVVFSGCSTAVGGPRHGSGLYGVTQSAMSNGAGTVVASLWPVDDRQTARLMTAMYADVAAQLSRGPADLRTALRAATLALAGEAPAAAVPPRTRAGRELGLDDEDLTGPARAVSLGVRDAFTIVGDPIVRP